MKVPFLNLSAQHKQIKKQIDQAINKVINRGDFISGKELKLFESEFARYCNRRFAVGVNSGTDALFFACRSLDIGNGDEVIVPAFTYIATALAVTFTGARPVFVDIDEDTYNLDIDRIKKAITKRTRAIIPVHLYGQPVEMKPILDIAKRYNLKVIEDAAQAHGARYRMSKNNWQLVGSIGDIGCFSFYPTKNLGALGDGGMVVTDDKNVYKRLLMLRDYGRKSRYEHITLGYNSRLDTIQAAILRIKLKHLNKWNILRRKKARIYRDNLKDIKGIIIPKEVGYGKHVYHIYAVRLKNRETIIHQLAKKGIGVLIHYPIPLHLQRVYKNLGYRRGCFPIAEKVAQEILSLPMYPQLKKNQIRYVTDTLKSIIRDRKICKKKSPFRL